MEIAPHVTDLRRLLGKDVLLLAWPLGKKGDRRRWKHLTADSMDDLYLQKLGVGNIGVALGSVSGGLCSLDIDSDEEVLAFLALNKGIENTLRSRGSRGCNFWWRMNDPYPPLTLIKRYGKAWGEWRANGAQTIISGQHPDGHEYKIVNRLEPIVIDFIQIKWPEGIYPLLAGAATPSDTERTEQTEIPEPTELSEKAERTEANRCGIPSGSSLVPITNIEEALVCSLPKQKNDNHRCLFTLARAVKALELSEQRTFQLPEMKNIFLQWHSRSRSFLNPAQSQDDYWFEFLDAFENADHPLGVDVIAEAWTRASRNQPPPEAQQFDTKEVRLLVSFCRELQMMRRDKPFFLASRTVQRLFKHDTHISGARWLRGLCRSGILKVAEQGGPKTNRATRFLYQHPL